MHGLSLARAGSILGVAITLLLTLRLASVQATRDQTGLIWGLALGFAYVAPFLLSSVALWLHDLERKGTVCVGAGVAGLLLMFTSLAGVGLLLLVPAVLLVLGGVGLLEEEAKQGPGSTLTFIIGPVAAVAVTFAALFARRVVSLQLLVVALAVWALLVARLHFLGRRAPSVGEVRT